MCIYKSEQVIKLRNALDSLEKIWTATEFARCLSIELSYVGCYARVLSEIHAKAGNIAKLKTALLSIWSSLIRQSCHFERDFDRVAEAGGHFEHSV